MLLLPSHYLKSWLFKKVRFLYDKNRNSVYKLIATNKLIKEAGIVNFLKLTILFSISTIADLLGIGFLVPLLFSGNSLNIFDSLSTKYTFLILFFLIIVKGYAKVLISIESHKIQFALEQQFSIKFFSLALNASLDQIESIGRGKLIALIEDDVSATVAALKHLILGFQELTSFLIFTFGVFVVAGLDTLPLILAIIATIVSAFLQRSNSYGYGEREIKLNASIQQTVADGLHSIKAVRAAQAENWILQRFSDDMINRSAISRQIIKRSALFKALRDTLVMGILGVWIVTSRQNLAASTITTTLLLAYKSSTSFSGVVNAQRLYLRLLPAYEELCIHRQKIMRKESHNSFACLKTCQTLLPREDTLLSISWSTDQDYSCRYQPLELYKGNLVAIVGTSGSGKTTSLDLFCGLKGEVNSFWTIQTSSNSYSFRGLSGAKRLKNIISYAPQNAVLFESSLRHNLFVGDIVSEEKIDKLYSWMYELRLNHLLDREKGLDTPLKLADTPFSGGEIQRLGLLRAWLRDEPIEVLDEPTAFLDKDTAEIVRAIITERVKQKLVLVSTHDPFLINQASEVITLQS